MNYRHISLNDLKAFSVVIIWHFVLKGVSSFSTSHINENRNYPERRPDSFRPKKWSGRNLTKPNKGKCHVLCLGRSNPLQEERQERAGWLQRSFAGQDLVGPSGELVGHGPAVCPCSCNMARVSIASRSRNKKGIEIQQRTRGWLGAEAWSVGGAAETSLGRGKRRGELPTATPWGGL